MAERRGGVLNNAALPFKLRDHALFVCFAPAENPRYAAAVVLEHNAHLIRNLDTPIETIVADPKAKAVLDADLPGLTSHTMYDQFKTMTLNQLAGMAPDKLTPEALAKTATDLALVK